MIPRAQGVKITRQTESLLEATFTAPMPRHRAVHYYGVTLREENWSVEETQSPDRTDILAVRGFNRLSLTFRSQGPRGVAIRLANRRLSEQEVEARGPPPLPKDLAFPPDCLWDRRIFAAAGDNVEIRGRCPKPLAQTLEQVETTLKRSGWQVRRDNRLLTLSKGDRAISVTVFSLKPELAAVRVRFPASEITGTDPRPAAEAGPADGRPGSAAADVAAAAPSGPRIKPQPGVSAKKPKEIETLALPDGWTEQRPAHDALAGSRWRYTNPSRDLSKLESELQESMRRQGWRRSQNLGRISLTGVVRVLVFSKRKKYLTATLGKRIEGATLDLLLTQ